MNVKPILSVEQINEKWPEGITKDKLAEYYGLTTFDTAIPQMVFDQLSQDDFDPWGHYVYDYSRWTFGVLFPLTTQAIEKMELNLDRPFIDPRKD